MMDINNLGNYESIEALWAAHPEGGVEGDYAMVDGVKYRWNKYDRIWENSVTVTETTARKTEHFYGDVAVHNDLTVAGTLRAKAVKQPNCGLFATVTALEAAYPNPDVGMWACVGDSTPADIYRCDTAGTWTATGETGGVDNLDLDEIEGDIADLEDAVEGLDGRIDDLEESQAEQDADIASIENALDEYTITTEKPISGSSTNASTLYINSTGKTLGGVGNTKLVYYAVTAGDDLKLDISLPDGATPASSVYTAAWFTEKPSGANIQGVTAINKLLSEAVLASPYELTVPAGKTYLGVTVWANGGYAALTKIVKTLDIARDSDVGEAARSIQDITVLGDESPELTRLSPYYPNTVNNRIGVSNSGTLKIDYCLVSPGDKFKLSFSGDFSEAFENAGAAFWADVEPQNKASLLSSALINDGSAMKLKDVDTTAVYELTAPIGATYLLVTLFTGCTTTLTKVAHRVDSSKVSTQVEWSVPSTVYAITGEEKRLYLDCIVKNYGNLVLGFSEGTQIDQKPSSNHPNTPIKKLYISGNCIKFFSEETGTTSVTINAYDLTGEKVSSKSINIVTIEKALPSTSKRVCIVGDSGTAIQNMAYYMKQKFISLFSDGATGMPIFVGTQSRRYAGTGNITPHEGYYGKSYYWLAGHGNDSDSHSPFCKYDTITEKYVIDIDNWRENCGLSANEKIDVFSFAMGANDANSEADAQNGIAGLKELITKLKEDNSDTIFIVQLITLLGTNSRVEKLNGRFRFRELILNDPYFAPGNENNVIIGDMGCCYDRWFAYRRETVHPAPCYTDDTIEIIKEGTEYGYSLVDTQHPTAQGSQQLGEAVVPALLNAM